MPDDGKTFHIQFPGNIMLEVHLQNPNAVHLTVKFSDNSGVNFDYEPDSPTTHKGTAGLVGYPSDVIPLTGIFASANPASDPSFNRQLRPASALAPGAIAASGGDVFILYNDPGGSKM